MDIEGIAKQAVYCGFRLHKDLGPGPLDLPLGLPLGLLMNFGQETFKQGIQRVVNNRKPL